MQKNKKNLKENDKCVRKVFVCNNGEDYTGIEIKDEKGNPITKMSLAQTLIKAMTDKNFSTQIFSPNVLSLTEGQMFAGAGAFGDNSIDPPYNPDQLAILLTLNATHYRCCSIKSTDITAQGFTFNIKSEFNFGEEQFTKEEKKIIEDQQKEVLFLLSNLNNRKGLDSLIKIIGLDYESIGYCAVEVVRNPQGKILNVVPIPAKTLRICRDPDTHELYYVQKINNQIIRYLPYGKKFKFDVNVDEEETDYLKIINAYKERKVESIRILGVKEEKIFEVKEISLEDKAELSGKDMKLFLGSATELLFLAQPHPMTDLYGVPEIIAGLAALKGNVSIEEYLTQFFENNAIPQYMIIIEGANEIDDNVVTTVTKFFTESIKGKNHATLIFPVPPDITVKVENLAVDVKEGSFQKTRANNRDEILVAHGMTPAQVGIIDVASLGSGTGSSQAENYKIRVLEPRQRFYEKQLINRLIGEEGMGLMAVIFEFVSLDIRDEETLRKKHEVYLKYGVMSINEVRSEISLPTIPGGDRNFMIAGNNILFIDELAHSLTSTQVTERVSNELNSTLNKILSDAEETEIKNLQIKSLTDYEKISIKTLLLKELKKRVYKC